MAYALLKIALSFALSVALTTLIAFLIMVGVFIDQDLLDEYFRSEMEDDGRTDYFRRR